MWLRTATKADLAAIGRLVDEIWHATYDQLLGVEGATRLAALEHSPAMREQLLMRPSSEFVVADDGKALAGIACATQGGKDIKADHVLLHQLYIHPQYQRQGIGKKLLLEMETCFPAARYMRLMVPEKNTKALQFYESQGYKSLGERLPVTKIQDIYLIMMEKPLAN